MVKLFIEIFKHSIIVLTFIEHLGVTHSSKALRTWGKFFIPILLEAPE